MIATASRHKEADVAKGKGMSLGDVIQADSNEKASLALGAASWYGWYLIARGVRKMIGAPLVNSKLKNFYKKPLKYKVNDW